MARRNVRRTRNERRTRRYRHIDEIRPTNIIQSSNRTISIRDNYGRLHTYYAITEPQQLRQQRNSTLTYNRTSNKSSPRKITSIYSGAFKHARCKKNKQVRRNNYFKAARKGTLKRSFKYRRHHCGN